MWLVAARRRAALPDLVREVKRSVEGREGWVPGSLGMNHSNINMEEVECTIHASRLGAKAALKKSARAQSDQPLASMDVLAPIDANLVMPPRRSLRSPLPVKSNKRDLELEECATEGRMTRSKVVPFDWAPLSKPLPTLALFDEVDETDEDEASDVDFVPEAEDPVAEEFEEDVGDEFETVAERGELSLEADEEADAADATLLAELADAEEENDEEDDEFDGCATHHPRAPAPRV